jgi:threonine dehydrogenase-like Zn-dependent dehydrogenase
MMRAAVITRPGEVEIHQVPVPEPGADEVRVRVEGSGVCASNLAVWDGQPWFTYPQEPGALGHEAWGTIDAVGAAVTRLAPGQRVAMLSSRAYAEYDIVGAEAVVALPPELADQPFPAEPLACALNIFARSAITAGQTVAIVGIGFLGALLTRLASNAGARVLAIGRRPTALALAQHYGAATAIAMDDHWRIIEQVKALTAGRGCDCVIEAVGKQWPLDLAAELTCERGRLVIAGYHQDGPRHVNMQLWNWRGLDVINAHERDPAVYHAGMRAAVESVLSGALDPAPLYTHTFELERLDEALNATRDRPDGFYESAGDVMTTRPRLGFLGVGWIGRHRMEAIARSGVAEIAAIADPVAELVDQALAIAPEAARGTTLEDLLALELDGLVIATPSALHASQAVAGPWSAGWRCFARNRSGATPPKPVR